MSELDLSQDIGDISNSENPMKDISVDGTPFSILLDRAMKLKSFQLSSERSKYESYPKFIQNTIFHGWGDGDSAKEIRNIRRETIPMEQKFEVAERLKNQGKQYFENGHFREACSHYEMASGVFCYLKNKNPKWKDEGIKDSFVDYITYATGDPVVDKKVQLLVLTCYLNIALTAFRMHDYKLSVSACSETLKIDPNNSKALYRRAQAHIVPKSSGAAEQERAFDDLKRAAAIDPECAAIRKEYRRLRQVILHQNRKDKKAFGGMFVRGSINDDRSELRVENDDDHSRKISLDKILEDAERMETYYKGAGREDKQHEIRQIINDVKGKRLDMQKIKGGRTLNFRLPSLIMIADAASRGVDLTDPRVIDILEKMQSEKSLSTTVVPSVLTHLIRMLPLSVSGKHIYLKALQILKISLLILSLCKAFIYLLSEGDLHGHDEGRCLRPFFQMLVKRNICW